MPEPGKRQIGPYSMRVTERRLYLLCSQDHLTLEELRRIAEDRALDLGETWIDIQIAAAYHSTIARPIVWEAPEHWGLLEVLSQQFGHPIEEVQAWIPELARKAQQHYRERKQIDGWRHL